jgi:hypothetical protein
MHTRKFPGILLQLFFIAACKFCQAQTSLMDCTAFLRNDTLVIANNRMESKWLWNKGNIIPFSVTNPVSGKSQLFGTSQPSFQLPGKPFLGKAGLTIIAAAPDTVRGIPARLEVSLTGRYGEITLKRVYRIFPRTPAISCDVYLKYSSLKIPDETYRQKQKIPFLACYPVNSKHWLIKTVEFSDQTDRHDNLVREDEFIPFTWPENHKGNLVLANNPADGASFFILKESPNTTSQINYPGYDYTISNKMITVPLSGFDREDATGDWVKGYTLTIGVGDGNPGNLFSLREYLKHSLVYDSSKHEMIMMNTWGDRGRDGKISEKFILNELETAKKLGITHFQIDDGWQQGLSVNSASASGKLWNSWTAANWKPNKERFPNGLDNIIQSARDKGIRLGLWFHPSGENDYATWASDASIIINLYKAVGVRYYKIDGVRILNKTAEMNFAKFLDTVKQATQGNVFFDLDLTAGTRGGYFMFRNAGNLFLENRYTDGGNYFPFHTLRNLWMLSQYFPPQLLQIAFLNKWRNENQYQANDPFAPAHYSFDYLFAITMMAQPLAWMEASGLPRESFTTVPLIKKYREIMADIHQGMIMPIGNMPDGTSWTGFQSVQDNHGYLLVFREKNDTEKKVFDLYKVKGKAIVFEKIYSNSETSDCRAAGKGKAEIVLPQPNSFALYEYHLANSE